ncbi:Type 1 glutamine amidotransferase-like domain-containing protein [Ruegeria arenilitoris]|uniref:Type 1 glutamine amidotransferase-like domain-containing protein n=1 Tax=Ruegeria arenilitoris TaxID=1173585 RepID=UPI001480C19B|nr:Type 1 glutamine amidotransferase-like domain-containing protein [Ruegeria arenilitoris]
MVTLVMYSDQIIPENEKVDARLRDLMAGRGRRIGYVPSGPEPDRRFYLGRQAYYAKLNLELPVFFDTTAPFDAARLTALFECDAIHLAGGDTLKFLQLLKFNGLLSLLAEWVRKDGLLIGTSAGAILMTPTIALDAIFRGDDPFGAQNSKALNFVPFEFFPHLNKSSDYLPQLLDYSSRTLSSIAACKDGDGIVVNDGNIESIGAIVWIKNGVIVDPLMAVR